ncbi:hypothetical protein RJ640_008639 [Escallonia rubra]|uniref:MAR-binding filament-like protein 1-1 n=1 Tax=Escallonia rubra TaxID=112253 RepID=A0AA88R8V4_9ASTE|nr:hypothetical protein RJ640_008639 [Escallonia rubra]
MGFTMGSSCFIHSPLHHSIFPTSSSQPLLLNTCQRNASGKRKYKTAVASMHQENPNDSLFYKRRAILFVGSSILPLLKLRAIAAEGLAPENFQIRTKEANQSAEQTTEGDASPNPFLSLLNGLGIFSSGVLGAFYALVQKEKATIEAVVESLETRLKEKEAAIMSLQKNFELEMLNKNDEQNKQVQKANKERQSLMNQLNSANSTIMGLGKELQSEKKIIEELEVQIDSLTTSLTRAGEDKKVLEEKLKEKIDAIEVLQERISLLSLEIKDKEDNLHYLTSALAAKEMELKNLSFMYGQTQDEVAVLKSEIKGLKNEYLQIEKEMELKNAAANKLNVQVQSLLVERDDSNRKLETIQKEYDDLKFSSEKKAASDAKLLAERDHKLHQLKEELKLALVKVTTNKELVVNLTKERDDMRKMLDVESKNAKNLEHELQITLGTLENSRSEASDLAKQLQQSRNLCSELEGKVSKIQAEFAEARESLQRNLVEANRSAEVLAGELTSTKEVLKKTNEELQIMSHEVAALAENRDSLQKELVDVYKKAESAVHDLKEEKKTVASLNKELKALETRALKDKEGRKLLETDLEEATKSLDEMNRKALILSKDLELSSSQILNLEGEKELLYKSLDEQKQVSQEARENVEDAHNLVMRMGKKRDSSEKKVKKLEEELASAKGEILRLRTKANSSKAVATDQQKGQEDGNAAVPVKKTTRRRKVVSQPESSL